jgi:hypothetical protein
VGTNSHLSDIGWCSDLLSAVFLALLSAFFSTIFSSVNYFATVLSFIRMDSLAPYAIEILGCILGVPLFFALFGGLLGLCASACASSFLGDFAVIVLFAAAASFHIVILCGLAVARFAVYMILFSTETIEAVRRSHTATPARSHLARQRRITTTALASASLVVYCVGPAVLRFVYALAGRRCVSSELYPTVYRHPAALMSVASVYSVSLLVAAATAPLNLTAPVVGACVLAAVALARLGVAAFAPLTSRPLNYLVPRRVACVRCVVVLIWRYRPCLRAGRWRLLRWRTRSDLHPAPTRCRPLLRSSFWAPPSRAASCLPHSRCVSLAVLRSGTH